MHYFLIIAIIAIIVFIQHRSFSDTKNKIKNLLEIFPNKSEGYTLGKLNNEEYDCKVKEIIDANFEKLVELCKKYNLDSTKYIYSTKNEAGEEKAAIGRGVQSALIAQVPILSGISVNHNNSTLKIILNSINDYLQNNKSVSDFHLLKDIVDRNYDAKEEEINTQIPIPLYWGLVGTMAGILIGVIFLVFSGELSNLLGTEPNGLIKWIVDTFSLNSEGGGIETLFGGVAIAMISSILGIILTTSGSNKFKNAKSIAECNKHTFLSWIQAKLLPTLSDNVVGAIREMTGNLENFNKEFAQNTGNLGSALEKVNESYKMQVQLLDSIRQIADKDLSQQNLKLYTALQNSTEEIGTLAKYLKNCNEYLTNVKMLNEKLDNYENRTQFIEKASNFYSKHENWLAENYDKANRNLEEVVSKYNTAIEGTFDSIKSDIERKRQELGTFIDNQNLALKRSAGDLDEIVKALSELGEVQKAVRAFESAIKGQNAKIERLADNIEKLAQKSSSGGIINIPIPKWIKIFAIVGFSILVLSGLIFLISHLIR